MGCGKIISLKVMGGCILYIIFAISHSRRIAVCQICTTFPLHVDRNYLSLVTFQPYSSPSRVVMVPSQRYSCPIKSGTHCSSVRDVWECVPQIRKVLNDDKDDTQDGRQHECTNKRHDDWSKHKDCCNYSDRLEHLLKLSLEANKETGTDKRDDTANGKKG